MPDLQLQTSPQAPEGMLLTATGRLVPDNGYGQLVDLLDAAFEMHNPHVTVVPGDRDGHGSQTDFVMPISAGDYVAADGSVTLPDGIVVTPDSEVVTLAIHKRPGGYNDTVLAIGDRTALIEWTDPAEAAEAA